MILVCNNRDAALKVLSYLESKPLVENLRLNGMRGCGTSVPSFGALAELPRWQETTSALAKLDEELSGK